MHSCYQLAYVMKCKKYLQDSTHRFVCIICASAEKVYSFVIFATYSEGHYFLFTYIDNFDNVFASMMQKMIQVISEYYYAPLSGE